MAKRPHIKLDTKKQLEAPIKLQFNYGKPDDTEDEERGHDYRRMAGNFRTYLNDFSAAQQAKIRLQNPLLEVPEHLDYIQVLFHDQFNVGKYFQSWYNDFGLEAVNFFNYNHEALFAIVDIEKFKGFIKSIEGFIAKESGANGNAEYDGKVRYIKSFQFLTAQQLLRFEQPDQLMNFKLVDFPFDNDAASAILKSLTDYLDTTGAPYRYDEETNQLEIQHLSVDRITEIAQNYDIILSVTSALSTVISPNKLNLPERSYGFTIGNADEDLPIIGILDTGISGATPLSAILIDDNNFNLTGTPYNEDNSTGGSGHGTAVAAFAALGKLPYQNQYRGVISADARLLSMKILDNNSGHISQAAVIALLKQAKAKYPGIKVFVLTVCYKDPKKVNELHSTYAFELDKFAHEYDCLIMICTANNDAAANQASYDISYFRQAETLLCSPADSMSNLIVGAAAASLRPGAFVGIAHGKEYPALYTRRSHIDLTAWFSTKKINKNYYRPDVIEIGGDYELHHSGLFFGEGDTASMEVLSANPSESFYSAIGTSFAAPLVANLAARLQASYPAIRTQSIKALIVNSASLDLIRFGNAHKHLLNKICGNGLVDDGKSLLSDDNGITFLIEDEIEPEKLAIFPLNFPRYLITDKLKKVQGILKITATLCFSFEPVLNSQLAYCPIHMAFCFFKNHTSADILKPSEEINSMLKSNLRWSQSGRYVTKPIPNMNTQKLSFLIGVEDLSNEQLTFKLGVNCRISKQLLPGAEKPYQKAHPFSLAIRIEEQLPESRLTGKLYNEMVACNQIINIASADILGEATAQAEAEQ